MEAVTYRDTKVAGAVHVGLLVGVLIGAAGLLGAAAQRGAGRLGTVLATAAATWIALGGTSLARTGLQMRNCWTVATSRRARRLLPVVVRTRSGDAGRARA